LSYKILHITNTTRGGAGKAALRTHLALHASGVNSKMLVVDCVNISQPNDIEVYQITQKVQGRDKQAFLRTKETIDNLVLNTANVSLSKRLEVFTNPFSPYCFEEHELIEWSDIIVLHWVNWTVDFKRFFKAKVKKPIIWRLADINPILGGVHYENDLKTLRKSLTLLYLERYYVKVKLNSLKNNPPKALVVTSKWVLDIVERRNFMSDAIHELIPNSVDTSLYKPLVEIESKKIKELMGINKNEKVVGIFAESLSNKRKGFHLLRGFLENLPEGIKVVAIGQEMKFNNARNIFSLGYIKEEDELAQYLGIMDCLLIPSIEEAFGQVFIESWACGTPTISLNVGAPTSIIEEEIYYGIVLENMEELNLRHAISTVFSRNHNIDDRKKLNSWVKTKYSPELQAQAYKNLFSRIMN
jgi:glycosyltransferase involved in cell wall biosynthesis